MSSLKQKILLLLLGGIAFGYSYTPQRQWKILKEVNRNWKDIDDNQLKRNIRNLYRSQLIKKKRNHDGSYTVFLTRKGKLTALTYHFQEMKIKTDEWDGKWRLVVFDIPENKRNGRDALRGKLRDLGFYELQKSVFIFPYECRNEIDFIVEFFGLKKYVRFGILNSIDNEIHLKEVFGLKQI